MPIAAAGIGCEIISVKEVSLSHSLALASYHPLALHWRSVIHLQDCTAGSEAEAREKESPLLAAVIVPSNLLRELL